MAADNGKVEGIGAKSYLPHYATCRDLRHKWDYIEWYGGKRTLVCVSCGTVRFDVLDAFDVISRHYKYPKGYSWKHEAIPVKTLRRELRRQSSQLVRFNKSVKFLKLVEEAKEDGRKGRPQHKPRP